jgi:hypothetical protein
VCEEGLKKGKLLVMWILQSMLMSVPVHPQLPQILPGGVERVMLNLRGTVRIEHQTTNNIVVAELIAHASGM